MGKILNELRTYLKNSSKEELQKEFDDFYRVNSLFDDLKKFEELVTKVTDESRANVFMEWLKECKRYYDHIEMIRNVNKFFSNEEMQKNVFDFYVTKLNIIVVEYRTPSNNSFLRNFSVRFYSNNVSFNGDMGLNNAEADNKFHNVTKEFLK